MGDFELDTRVRGEAGRYRATLSEDWRIWGPNGGYLAAIALRAVGCEAHIARPASFYAHFLSVGRFSDVELEVEAVRLGKRSESFRVRMLQDGKALLEGMVRTAAAGPGLEHDVAEMPQVALPAELRSVESIVAELPARGTALPVLAEPRSPPGLAGTVRRAGAVAAAALPRVVPLPAARHLRRSLDRRRALPPADRHAHLAGRRAAARARARLHRAEPRRHRLVPPQRARGGLAARRPQRRARGGRADGNPRPDLGSRREAPRDRRRPALLRARLTEGSPRSFASVWALAWPAIVGNLLNSTVGPRRPQDRRRARAARRRGRHDRQPPLLRDPGGADGGLAPGRPRWSRAPGAPATATRRRSWRGPRSGSASASPCSSRSRASSSRDPIARHLPPRGGDGGARRGLHPLAERLPGGVRGRLRARDRRCAPPATRARRSGSGALANVVNVVLAYGLVNGRFGLPRLGVAGAAIASGIAFSSCAVALRAPWLRGRLRLGPGHGRALDARARRAAAPHRLPRRPRAGRLAERLHPLPVDRGALRHGALRRLRASA